MNFTEFFFLPNKLCHKIEVVQIHFVKTILLQNKFGNTKMHGICFGLQNEPDNFFCLLHFVTEIILLPN